MPEFLFELADSDTLEPIEELKNADNRNLTLTLNRAGSFSFNLRLEDEICNCIEEATTCVVIKRKKVSGEYEPIWSGPIWTIRESTPNTIDVSAVGWLQTLEKRFLTEDSQFTDTDAGEIATTILEDSNLAGEGLGAPSRVLPGTVLPSINRTRSYKSFESILSIIQGLSNIENGYDFEVNPITRELNIYPVLSNETTAYFEYGVNVQSVERESDSSRIVNRMFVFGANNTHGGAQDNESISELGLFEETTSLSDVSDETILNAYANAELATRSRPLRIFSFTPIKASNLTNTPRLFDDFNIGDIVYLTVNKGRLVADRQRIRVFGVTMVFDTNGNEQLTTLQSTASG